MSVWDNNRLLEPADHEMLRIDKYRNSEGSMKPTSPVFMRRPNVVCPQITIDAMTGLSSKR